nr:hypothetical protein [Tanacetum cinerariifolium]
MDTTIDQQVAMDEAFVPHAKKLRIGGSNIWLLSDIKSEESTLQLVYDVLRLCPFFKAFLVTADVSKIYMQEFWATATAHHHSIRFKMDNKKHIVNLESFREMLHICPRLPHQPFVEPPFKEEILAFLRFLGHNFVYHVEHKDTKKSNEMYYPRFTKVIIRHFMSNDPSIPRRNKVNWHYVRDDHMFSTIKLICRHQNTQWFGALLPIELTNEDIRKSNAYKEYYAVATGATPPKPKASVWKTRSSSDTTITPPTAVAGPRMTTSKKGKQAAKATKAKSLSAPSKVAMTEAQQLKLVTKRSLQQTHISQASGSGADEGTGSIPGVPDVPTAESREELYWNSTDEEGDDDEGKDGDDDDDDDQEVERDDEKDDEEEGGDDEQASDEEEFIYPSLCTHTEEETRDEESFDPIPKTPENDGDEGNGEKDLGLNVGREEGHDEEEEEDKLYRDVNITQGRGIQTTQEVEDSHVTLPPVNPDDSNLDAPLPMSAPTITSSTIATITATQQAPLPPTIAPSTLLQDLPNFGSLFRFDNRLKTLEANFSEFMQTNQFAGASDRLPEEAQKEEDEFLKTVDVNMQKIIKEQVKEQVKVQVSKILPKIEQTVNEQLKAKVLTRSSNSLKTSYAVAANLSEMELKKILIEKIEGNKSIHRSNEQRNLYKALVEAYESDKIILDIYGDTTSASESATAEEPMQTIFEIEEPAHPEFETGADDQPIVESSQHPEWFSQQQKPPTLDHDWNKTLPTTHGSIQPWISELVKQSESRSSFNELMDTLVDFSNFLINLLKVDTLTPELLAGPTYELLNGSCKSLVDLEYHLEEVYKATTDQLDWVNPEGQQYPHNLLKPLPLIPNNRGRCVIPFDHFINNDLEYLRGGASSHKYTTSVTKTKAADYGHIKWIEDLVPRTMWIQEPIGYDKHALWGVSHWRRKRHQFYGFAVNWESARDVYSKRRIIARRVEDLQMGVESYHKKLNLTKPDTYRFDLKRKEAYIAYSNPRGFIYQNKDKKNRLMRIDELHKFSDGTLTDVRTALDDRLKGIRMQYLPQSNWRKSDKDRAAAMIQAIDKRLKTRRIMRSLERFVGGRLYEGDFRMLQRTI